MVKVQLPAAQSQTEEHEYSVANEEIGEELLLRCWKEAEDQVNEAIKINKNSGLRYPDMYISYYDEMGPMDVLQKKRWLASTINPKTGEFHTLTELKVKITIEDAI